METKLLVLIANGKDDIMRDLAKILLRDGIEGLIIIAINNNAFTATLKGPGNTIIDATSNILRGLKEAEKVVALAAYGNTGRRKTLSQLQPYTYTAFTRHSTIIYHGVINTTSRGGEVEYFSQIVGLEPSSYEPSLIIFAWLTRQLSYGLTLQEAANMLLEKLRKIDAVVLEARQSRKTGMGLLLTIVSKEPGKIAKIEQNGILVITTLDIAGEIQRKLKAKREVLSKNITTVTIC